MGYEQKREHYRVEYMRNGRARVKRYPATPKGLSRAIRFSQRLPFGVAGNVRLVSPSEVSGILQHGK